VLKLSAVLAVLISTSCGPSATPQASPQFTTYQYTVAIPTTPLAPNEQLHLVWEPHLAPASTNAISALQFCIALFGPWESVAALKTAMAAAGPRTCPPTGAAVSTDTMSTTSNSGARLATDLVAPDSAADTLIYGRGRPLVSIAPPASGGVPRRTTFFPPRLRYARHALPVTESPWRSSTNVSTRVSSTASNAAAIARHNVNARRRTQPPKQQPTA
jgi:hypothetical protein